MHVMHGYIKGIRTGSAEVEGRQTITIRLWAELLGTRQAVAVSSVDTNRALIVVLEELEGGVICVCSSGNACKCVSK